MSAKKRTSVKKTSAKRSSAKRSSAKRSSAKRSSAKRSSAKRRTSVKRQTQRGGVFMHQTGDTVIDTRTNRTGVIIRQVKDLNNKNTIYNVKYNDDGSRENVMEEYLQKYVEPVQQQPKFKKGDHVQNTFTNERGLVMEDSQNDKTLIQLDGSHYGSRYYRTNEFVIE
jgi:hypothetical protein